MTELGDGELEVHVRVAHDGLARGQITSVALTARVQRLLDAGYLEPTFGADAPTWMRPQPAVATPPVSLPDNGLAPAAVRPPAVTAAWSAETTQDSTRGSLRAQPRTARRTGTQRRRGSRRPGAEQEQEAPGGGGTADDQAASQD